VTQREIGYDGTGRPVYASDSRDCKVCGETKGVSEFRATNGGYRLRTCRSCESRDRRKREAGESLE
jgi:hypothetical protein